MKPTLLIQAAVIAAAVLWHPLTAAAEDINIIYKHDKSGMADEVIRMKEFDYELLQRERARIEQENLEDSMAAMRVGDVYLESGETTEAIAYYQIAIKMDPSNTRAHEKYIAARDREEAETSSHYHQAMEYYRQGMKEAAVDELIREIQAHPDNEKARIRLREIEQ